MDQNIIPGTEYRTQESFVLLLAHHYLQQETEGEKSKKILLSQNKIHTQVQCFYYSTIYTEDYQGIDSLSFQVLFNYGANTPSNVAKVLTLEDILKKNFNRKNIKGKIILMGVMSIEKDLVMNGLHPIEL